MGGKQWKICGTRVDKMCYDVILPETKLTNAAKKDNFFMHSCNSGKPHSDYENKKKITLPSSSPKKQIWKTDKASCANSGGPKYCSFQSN